MARKSNSVDLRSVLNRSRTGWYFLDVPTRVAKRFETDPRTRRVVCTLNDSHTFQCALNPNGKGDYCIGVNKAIRERLGLEAGDTVSIKIEKDTSKYGAAMPEEFAEVLRQDPEGDRLFHALTGGMQRSLLYMIAAAKNIDKRIHLSLIVVEHLKNNGGKIDPEQLQQDIKRPVL
jgi:bifunctional DNA-binding transcriptional regulator/antitoxin component of YhaV-PrlF toxin-antitoxin module